LQSIAASGSTAGPVMGALTDAEMYRAFIQRDVASVAAVTEAVAGMLIEQGVRCVVADAFELYNPTHDLCSVVATLAAARARASTGIAVERYDYAVATAASGAGIVLELDPVDVDRKIAAAYRFENLTNEVNDLLATLGREEISREILRPVSMSIDLPVPVRKPYYETRGEERVASGRYRTVLRYEEHFLPFVEALAAAVGYGVIPERRQAAIA